MGIKRISRRSFLKLSAMVLALLSFDWEKAAAYAAAIEPKKDYPIIVIGAGLGGLCCGAYLSRFGFPVTVVEQHSIPGGYTAALRSGQLTFGKIMEDSKPPNQG